MNFLAWIVFGLIAGWLANTFMGTGKGGFIFNLVLGIVGAVFGGYMSTMLGGQGVTGFNLRSIIVAAFGAAILIFIVRNIVKK